MIRNTHQRAAARIARQLHIVALLMLLLMDLPPALAAPTAARTASQLAQRAAAATQPVVTMTADVLDNDSNGQTGPGDSLRYVVTISNTTSVDLSGVTFSAALDPYTTLSPDPIKISPLTSSDSYTATKDTPIAQSAPGVLANDIGTPAPTVIPFSGPTNALGLVIISADGSFSYTPPPGYSGIDSFNYTASTAAGHATGTVTISVRATPIAGDDRYMVGKDTPRQVAAPGVLANDRGFPPPNATPLSGATAQGGTVTLAANGGFSYTPPAGYSGPDSFDYTASNAAGSDTGTVALIVGSAPLAVADATYVTAINTPLNVPAAGLLQNDTLGAPAATLTAFGGGSLLGTVTSNAAGTTASFGTGGTLKVNADGSFAFTPSAGFTGAFTFRYQISNEFGTSDSLATIAVQQAPAISSANAITFTAGVTSTFVVTATGFPTPAISQTGALPNGVTFVDNANGTATLSGMPGVGTGAAYPLTFTASNGAPPDATQSFTLTVMQDPAISSANAITFTAGVTSTFVVTTTGFPTPAISQTGALPNGVTFADNGDGTGELSGAPDITGTYALTFIAGNGVLPDATQQFTLTVAASSPQILGVSTSQGAPPRAAPQASSVNVAIGTIPAGKAITIVFDAVIAGSLSLNVAQIVNQGVISATGLASILTDDPSRPGVADPTIIVLRSGHIYMPLISQLVLLGPAPPPDLPDLIVERITTSGGRLQVTIKNIGGTAVAEQFLTDLYINPTTAPTHVNQLWSDLSTHGATWIVSGSALPLAPGATLTLSQGDAFYQAGISDPGGVIAAGTPIYAQVDSYAIGSSYGAVLEPHERDGKAYNNILRVLAPGAVERGR